LILININAPNMALKPLHLSVQLNFSSKCNKYSIIFKFLNIYMITVSFLIKLIFLAIQNE
jgi:hypothetical protein